jgi:hypothetical protein
VDISIVIVAFNQQAFITVAAVFAGNTKGMSLLSTLA